MAEELKLNNPDELEDWLKDKPAAWSQIIAFRSALRVLPALGDLTNPPQVGPKLNRDKNLIIVAFRSNLLSSALHTHQADRIISAAADDAADATYRAVNSAVGNVAGAMQAAAGAVTAAGCAAAASAAAHDDDVEVARNCATQTVGSATYAAADAAYEDNDDYKDDDGVRRLWLSISLDALWLELHKEFPSPKRSALLARQPLWHGNAPKRLQAKWHHLANSELATRHRFECWIRWYEALSPFDATTTPRDAFGEALTRRIATQSNVWWKRPAEEINTDIARWLAEEQTVPSPPPTDDLSIQLTEALDALPGQQPAPYQFDWRDGRMVVLPPDALPEDGGLAQDFLDETREKAGGLFERLERTNTDPDIRRKIGKLLDVLTERVTDLRPALVKSRSLSITALADAHNTPQDERELSAGVLADLIDLDLTAKELCASLPDLARQDIERLVDAMASVEDAETARSGLDAIRRGAEEAELLGPDARAALAGLSEDAAEPAVPALKKRRVALLMATVRNLLLKALRVPGMAVKATAGALWRFMKDSGKEFRGLLVKGTAYSLLVAAGTAPLYFVATQTEAISVVARYAEGFKDIEQILKLAGRLRTPPE
ncbi:hypothetical protein [Azospirillum griseum]|uniref:Uncharacterized protein n=1 Tax=Azospirillum griseum TaxID=2496639 RepID=A0A3S0K4M4_9PROT|nr:hypothetical protein [Azospirillum griseum]RTR19798.1 hypothetical protein EJ903_12400 [Azospirillum griseum]